MLFRSKPIVRVRITGGLGNQLFQYAVGLAISTRVGASLFCDTGSYRHRTRKLQLGAFGIRLRRPWPRGFLGQLLSQLSAPDMQVVHDSAEFVPAIMTTGAPVQLVGWFQNWRYFDGITDQLRRIYDFERLPLSPAARQMLEQIQQSRMPIAVHVRRGDYAKRPDLFPLLDRQYYDRARAHLEAAGATPSYFLFSDQPALARDLLGDWPRLTVVEGFESLEDFRLMASCTHFVIANSTFSWWAAWLGRAPDKQVMAPTTWLGPEFSRPIELDERLPPDWIRL